MGIRIMQKINKQEIQCPFGMRDGHIIHIDEIKSLGLRGLKCGCVCPACGGPLEARIGEIKQAHFAHSKEGCSSEAAYETAVHKLAKQIIKEEKKLRFPKLTFPENIPEIMEIRYQYYLQYQNLFDGQIVVSPGKVLQLDWVELEKSVGDIRPDIMASANGQQFFIEIAVFHFVDEEKLNKIRALNMPTIEIDLSKVDLSEFNPDALKHEIIENVENRKYVYYPWMDNAKKKSIKLYQEKIDSMDEFKERTKHITRRRNEMMGLRDDKRVDDIIPSLSFAKKLKNCAWPFYLDIPITDEVYIDCDRRVWQSIIFDKFVYNRSSGELSFEKIKSWLQNYNEEFGINWNVYDRGGTKEKASRFYEAIKTYLRYLSLLGFISPIYMVDRKNYHRFTANIWNPRNLNILDLEEYRQRAFVLENIIHRISEDNVNPDDIIDDVLHREFGSILVELTDSVCKEDQYLD
jgi:hypothetical protein